MFAKKVKIFLICCAVIVCNFYFTPITENGVFTSSNLMALPQKVFLGGDVVGFEYQSVGVLVTSNEKNLVKKNRIQAGDIIIKINDLDVNTAEEISTALNGDNAGEDVKLTLIRDDKKMVLDFTPTFDIFANEYKLGVWVKDTVSGIGTVTYITHDNKFGALGHPISDSSTGKNLSVKTGKVYNCNILGINRGGRGVPGELRGVISKRNVIGAVKKVNEFGVYGNVDSNFVSDKKLIDIGGRKVAKPGKAVIYSSIDGKNIKPYNIQIIKTNYQSVSDEKSLVFKITDKELIEKTGGILQGMSGSPIVQNGKLIGAVTHVFLNDSTKGFGLYIDWMM